MILDATHDLNLVEQAKHAFLNGEQFLFFETFCGEFLSCSAVFHRVNACVVSFPNLLDHLVLFLKTSLEDLFGDDFLEFEKHDLVRIEFYLLGVQPYHKAF